MNLAQISSSVIFITVIAILTGEKINNFNVPNDFRIPNYVTPLHYSIKIRTYFKSDDFYMVNLRNTEKTNFFFYGESNITINIHRSTQNITLHTINLNVNELKIKMIKSDSIIYVLKELSHDYTMHLSNLHFVDVLSPGLYTLKMEFTSHIITDDNVEKNFFRSSYTSKEDMTLLIAPHVQAIGVQLFSSNEPNLKSTFTISVKFHRDFTVLSNMPIRTYNIKLNEDLIWIHFHTTPPLSTYQVSILITNFYRVHITMTVSLWCAKCQKQHYIKFAQQVMTNITLHLESEFKEIKFPKIDHVAIPNFPYNSISKWGLVFHREVDVIYDEKVDSVIRKMEIAHLIALKIAYQWVGNVVGPSWWSNLWLYSGLATIYGEEAIAKTSNISWMRDLFIVQNQYESLHLDSHFDMIHPQINSLSEIDSIFSFSRYMKAPIVLRMLQSLVTDKVFRKGVHAYLDMYMFGSVTLHFFWATMQKEVNKITDENMNDITESFTTWMAYADYPIVTIEQYYNGYVMSQKDFNILNNKKWWIPMNYIMRKTLESTSISLIPQESHFRILSTDEDGWIIINFEQTAGYYRVNYEFKNWRRISNYLSSGGYNIISVISRAKMIDDAFHLLMASQFNITIFWEFTKYLSHETNYAAWYPMIKAIECMSSIFPFSRYDISFINDIKENLSKILKDSLRTLGLEKRATENDLTESLRQEIAKWACTLALTECMEMAKHNLQKHLRDPEKYKILPEWKEWTYCNGLKIAEYSMWNNVTNIWLRKPDHQLLPFLACCRYRFITSEHLPYLVSQRFTQYDMQHIAIIRSYIKTFHSIIARHANNYNFLKNMLLNWEKIKPEFYKEFDTNTFLTVIINHVYSQSLLHEIPNFLKKVKYIKEGQMLKIQHKIKTRLSEIKNLIGYFQVMDFQVY